MDILGHHGGAGLTWKGISFRGWQKGFQLLDVAFPADPDNWALGEDISLLRFENNLDWVEFEVVE